MSPGTASGYDTYVRAEWERFLRDPVRARALLDAAADVEARLVLDVGCGSGQALIPFVEREATSIGLDLSPEVGRAGVELFAALGRAGAVAFVRGAAEALPFRDGIFDVVICRVALPYMDNARVLGELIRVLRRGGVVLLQTLTLGNYLRDFAGALRRGSGRSMTHASRVVAAGALYHLLGRQVRRWPLGGETFQSEWLLRREIARAGGILERRLPVPDVGAAAYRIVKP